MLWCAKASYCTQFFPFDFFCCFMYNIFGSILQTVRAPPYHMDWCKTIKLRVAMDWKELSKKHFASECTTLCFSTLWSRSAIWTISIHGDTVHKDTCLLPR